MVSRYMKGAVFAAAGSLGALSIPAHDAEAQGSEFLFNPTPFTADDVVINQTMSFALVHDTHSEASNKTRTYQIYHDGKSRFYALDIHPDGRLHFQGRDMNSSEERNMFETLRDTFSRTQPELSTRDTPAARYATTEGLPVGGSDTPAGMYETGYNERAREGWIGSCALADADTVICLTNIYEDAASTYTMRVDVHNVTGRGRDAKVTSAESSRPFNGEREETRFERMVQSGQQGIFTFTP